MGRTRFKTVFSRILFSAGAQAWQQKRVIALLPSILDAPTTRVIRAKIFPYYGKDRMVASSPFQHQYHHWSYNTIYNAATAVAATTGFGYWLQNHKTAECARSDEDQVIVRRNGGLPTRISYEKFLEGVVGDKSRFQSVEFREPLTSEQLQALANALGEDYERGTNKELGYIKWAPGQKGTAATSEEMALKAKIEERLAENNQRHKPYPSDFVHAWLSRGAYAGSTVVKNESLAERFEALGKDATSFGEGDYLSDVGGSRNLTFDFALNNGQLEELKTIASSTGVGLIKWHKEQWVGADSSMLNLKDEIEQASRSAISTIAFKSWDKKGKVEEDLSSKYQEVAKALADWKVKKYWDDTKESGYFSVLYVNQKTHQAVLAVRGSEDFIKEAKSGQYGDWATDFNEIIGGNVVATVNGRTSQQPHNLGAFRDTYKLINGNKKSNDPQEQVGEIAGYTLSFTGHSLGGWLASMCLFHARRKGMAYAKAVTFDSPGTFEMMEKLSSNLHKDKIDIKALDITTYLALPNVVNTANHHVGRVYLVKGVAGQRNVTEQKSHGSTRQGQEEQAPPQSLIDSVSKACKAVVKKAGKFLGGKIEEVTSRYQALQSTAIGHPLAGILEKLEAENNSNVALMRDWPSLTRVRYQPQDMGQRVSEALLPDIMVLQFLFLMRDYWTGGIDDTQIAAAYKCFKDDFADKEYLSRKFMKNFIAHFKEQKEARYILDLQHNEIDQKLYGLWNNRHQINSKLKGMSEVVHKQFLELVGLYLIKKESGGWIITKRLDKQKEDIEDIRSRMLRLLKVMPEEEVSLITGDAQSIRLTEWLPPRIPAAFTEETLTRRVRLTDEMGSILASRAKILVLHGHSGTGKTALAADYALRKKRDGESIRWLRASSRSQLKSECIKLAADMGVPTVGDIEIMRDLVYSKLETAGKITFILDNVEDMDAVLFLLGREGKENALPENINVVITTQKPPKGSTLKGVRFETLQVGPFSTMDAQKYLYDNLAKGSMNDQKLQNLMAEIGTLPLELLSAVSLFRRHGSLTVNDFVAEIKAWKQEIAKRGMQFQDGTEKRAATSLLISKLNQREMDLLLYFSMLDPDMIPYEVVSKMGVEKQSKILERLIRDKLIEHGGEESYRIHRGVLNLVRQAQHLEAEENRNFQERLYQIEDMMRRHNQDGDLSAVRTFLDNQTKQHKVRIERLIDTLASLMPTTLEDYAYGTEITSSQRFGASAVEVVKKAEQYSIRSANLCALLRSIAYGYKVVLTDYEKGAEYARKAIEMAEFLRGGSAVHEDVAKSHKCLGDVYYPQNKYEEAAKEYREALQKMREIHKGMDNSELAAYINDLATATSGEERYLLMKEAYEMRERLYNKLGAGETSIKTLFESLHNLLSIVGQQIMELRYEDTQHTEQLENQIKQKEEEWKELYDKGSKVLSGAKDVGADVMSVTANHKLSYALFNYQKILFQLKQRKQDKTNDDLTKALVPLAAELGEVVGIRDRLYVGRPTQHRAEAIVWHTKVSWVAGQYDHQNKALQKLAEVIDVSTEIKDRLFTTTALCNIAKIMASEKIPNIHKVMCDIEGHEFQLKLESKNIRHDDEIVKMVRENLKASDALEALQKNEMMNFWALNLAFYIGKKTNTDQGIQTLASTSCATIEKALDKYPSFFVDNSVVEKYLEILEKSDDGEQKKVHEKLKSEYNKSSGPAK